MADAPDPGLVQLIMELRGQGVTDGRVLNAMERVPRQAFVDQKLAHMAYENQALPIGYGQTITQPFTVGLMTHALKLGERMKVLEIGTGSGYQAAILSQLALRVYSVERHKPLMKMAEQRFAQLGYSNIVTRHTDGHEGWPEQAPFDRIIQTAASADIQDRLVDQLKVGGILVCPVGPADAGQVLLRVTKHNDGKEVENLGFVAFVTMAQGVARDG